jgi:tricorn protease
MTAPGYLRYPTLRGDLIAFVADDDVWLGPAAGGRAWRISADQAPAEYPRISGDGRMIAWTSWRDGPPEVYLASTDGGTASRVTFWSSWSTRVRGWDAAGQIIATTAADQPFGHHTWAYSIPVADGAARFSGRRKLPFGPVGDIVMDDGAVALLTGTLGSEPAFWKRYRGGTAGRLWVGVGSPDGAGTGGRTPFTRVLAGLAGQFFSPMLVGGRLAFISDHEGTGNIYSCALDGTDLRRHTDHDGFYARNASSDGARIVYQVAGDLWLLADLAADSEPTRLEISLGMPAAGRAPVLVCGDDHLDDLCCDRTGQASVISVRGSVHWLTHKDGPARALSQIPGPIARLPRVLGDSGDAVWVVEADDGDALEIGAADGGEFGEPRRRLAAGEIGWVADLAAAPDGATVAVAARDGRLLLVDIESATVTELASSDSGTVGRLAFAPDSAWLAWSQRGPYPLTRIRLARLADRQVIDVTDGRFIDTDPVFTADGLYLAFLSKRTFDPVYDAHFFDLTFPYGSRPHLVTLAAATPSPFGPLIAGRPVGGGKDSDQSDQSDEDESGTDTEGGSADERNERNEQNERSKSVKPVVIDILGLNSRISPLPVPESRYATLYAVEGGLAWLREPLTGNLGEGGARLDDDAPRPALEYFDIKRARCTELLAEVNWFKASGDGTKLVVCDRPQLFVVPATRKVDADGSDDRVSVDLSRARFRADPVALWRSAFAEAGRVMRHEFWVSDMGDVDWDAVLGAYRPLLDRIATADDFADLLHETIAELGSSHAYVSGAGRGQRTWQLAGHLGADIEPDSGGWRIARILPGESSDPQARSPLAAPGVLIEEGDVLLAVDGQQVDAELGPGPLLVGAAGKPVELTVGRPGDKPRRVVVVPLADEDRLRYQAWVAARRAIVRELGRGLVGYLHVPDMVSRGWSDFHRDLRSEMLRDALIVDVRANRGGHTSQLVVEKLSRRIIGWKLPRRITPRSYPMQAPRGPVVAIADEAAGSDGDIVTAAIRELGIGPVVGTRTWGGVIGIDGFHELVDGTSMTVPKYGHWFSEYGWDVENYGVEPDVEVVMSPDDWAQEHDVQLQAAVSMALDALERSPAASPPGTADRPSRRRSSLPPRRND